MKYIPYMVWLRANLITLIPITLLAITGIAFSSVHFRYKKAYPVFSLLACILALLNLWLMGYIKMSILYYSGNFAARNGITITNVVLFLIAGIFLLLAIFSGRKMRAPAPYTGYPYYPHVSQQSSPTTAQQPNFPPSFPQSPQNPPNLPSH